MPAVPRAASAWRSEPSRLTDSAGQSRRLAVQRLKSRNQFQAVLAGRRVASTAHFALHRCELAAVPEVSLDGSRAHALFGSADVWLGAMVPKRWAKRAVTRNAIKRQIYHVASHFESGLAVAAHVIRLRAGFDRMVFPSATSDALKVAVRNELQQLLTRATQATPSDLTSQ